MIEGETLDLSVIVAARNCEKTLQSCLDVFTSELFLNFSFEIILINDASQDQTLEVAKSYLQILPIDIISVPERIGSAAARNLAIARSRSEFLLIMDADDILIPSSLSSLMQKLHDDPRTSVVFGPKIAFGDWGISGISFPDYLNPEAIHKFVQEGHNVINHSGTIFRKNWFLKLGGYSVSYKRAADLNLWYRGLGFGTYAMIKQPVVYYRMEKRFPSYRYWYVNEIYRRQFKLKQAHINKYQLLVSGYLHPFLFCKYSLVVIHGFAKERFFLSRKDSLEKE
jgi:glycosyltransferase involved in cell wall biosynthesis